MLRPCSSRLILFRIRFGYMAVDPKRPSTRPHPYSASSRIPSIPQYHRYAPLASHKHSCRITVCVAYTHAPQAVPGATVTADMIVDNPGNWMYHCHVNEHLDGGMIAVFTVHPPPANSTLPTPLIMKPYDEVRRELGGAERRHYILATEVCVCGARPGDG